MIEMPLTILSKVEPYRVVFSLSFKSSVFLLGKFVSHKIFIVLFLIFSFSTSLAWSPYPDVQLLGSDEDGVVFKYTVQKFTTSKIKTQGKTYDLIRIPSCTETESVGKPQLPQRIVILGVPAGCEIKVKVLDSKYQERSDLYIAPVPGILYDWEEMPTYQFSEDLEAYSKNQFYPEDPVSSEKSFWIRDQRVVRIILNPFCFNPQNKKTRIYESITLRIDFAGEKSYGEKTTEKKSFEDIYKNVLLNYQQAKSFRQKKKKPALFKTFGESPFIFSDVWYKIEIEEEGIYKIDRSDLEKAGINVDEINPKDIRIFNGGGRELPLDNSEPRPKLKEQSIEVFGQEDGKFDQGDYILFYGWSVNGWEYDTSKGEYQHYRNHYTNRNVFWLTFSGSFPDSAKRIKENDCSLIHTNFYVPQAFKEHVFEENDKEVYTSGGYIYDYFNWYESKSNSYSKNIVLDNVKDDSATIKVKTRSTHSVKVKVNGTNASILDHINQITYALSDRIKEGENRIDFEFTNSIYFDWYEFFYMREFKVEDNELMFVSPDTSGIIEYHLSGVGSASVLLLDITDRFNPQRLVGFKIESDTLRFQDELKEKDKKRYYLFTEADLIHPRSITYDEKSNLKDQSNQADILVIAHPDLSNPLYEYELMREQEGVEVRTIDVFDIYDEFSCGIFDPVAIRDFLKFSFDYWQPPKPSFVLLVGDGNYDFKNNLAVSPKSKIPPLVALYPVSDDNFIYFGNPGDLDSDSEGEVDMIIGRIPAKSGFEVETFMEKIWEYEKEPVFRRWRNTVTLVADDFNEGCADIDGLWNYHTRDTEILAESHIPRSFNLNKIYLLDFPFDVNWRKPGATDAIVDAFNHGTVLLNWIGHGNTQQWAHEKVFKRVEDIPRLENKGMYPLVFSATCSNAIFFDPLKESLAEDLARVESKGAIGVISSTGRVSPGPNAALNFAFYDYLLDSKMRIGEALFSAKLSRQSAYNAGNDRYYVLLGDPYTKLASPRLQVKIKDVNPDTLSALRLVRLKGEVTDSHGNLKDQFFGVADILALDSKRERSHLMPNDSILSYELSGQVIFRGSVEVKSGIFDASFFVPKDVSYGGNTARLSVYSKDSYTDGAGALDSLVVLGSDSGFADTLGPEIKVGFSSNPDFQEGDFIKFGATMILEVSDSSGINLTGEVGHGISLIFDEDWENQVDLTDSFEYDKDNYQRGSISYGLSEILPGEHLLKIKAWDNFNNSTLKSINFGILSVSDFKLDVLNYPNPFSDKTNFWYRTSGEIERVEVKIYTMAGRLIRTIGSISDSQGFLVWDRRDQDGDLVANGVYIYKIVAFGDIEGSGKKAEAYGKVLVMH